VKVGGGGVHKLNAVIPGRFPRALESAWFQPLRLKRSFLVSTFLLLNWFKLAPLHRGERQG
jgi:hypothetical protein